MTANYMKRSLLFCFLTCFVTVSATASTARKITSAEAAQIIKKLGDWYKDTEKYSMEIEIKSYKDYSTDVVHETQTGFARKSGKNFHSLMMGTHTIQNEKYRFTIDSLRNFMSIKDAELNMWENINPVILENYLNESSTIMLTELEGSSMMKIIPPVNSALKQYELTYDKSFRIINIKMEMQKEEMADDGRTTFTISPKITFQFRNYTNGSKINPKEFLTENYVRMGPEVVANKEYSKFEFFDLRVKDKLKQ
ncbi:MAG: hypothetical protein ABI772_12350 [Bacteroidota bacterium]